MLSMCFVCMHYARIETGLGSAAVSRLSAYFETIGGQGATVLARLSRSVSEEPLRAHGGCRPVEATFRLS